MGTIAELNQYARAFRERWDIPPKFRELAIEKIMLIIGSPESRNREVIAAFKALLAADLINMRSGVEIDDQSVTDESRNRFASVIERIRTDRVIEVSAGEREAASDCLDAIANDDRNASQLQPDNLHGIGGDT